MTHQDTNMFSESGKPTTKKGESLEEYRKYEGSVCKCGSLLNSLNPRRLVLS